jgi:hypothetical protein
MGAAAAQDGRRTPPAAHAQLQNAQQLLEQVRSIAAAPAAPSASAHSCRHACMPTRGRQQTNGRTHARCASCKCGCADRSCTYEVAVAHRTAFVQNAAGKSRRGAGCDARVPAGKPPPFACAAPSGCRPSPAPLRLSSSSPDHCSACSPKLASLCAARHSASQVRSGAVAKCAESRCILCASCTGHVACCHVACCMLPRVACCHVVCCMLPRGMSHATTACTFEAERCGTECAEGR